MSNLKIGLDYDQTYTADPELWDTLINVAVMRGHEVTFVTYRNPDSYNADIICDTQRLGVKVIYTAGMQKSRFYKADIWIDDSPETIPKVVELSKMVTGCLVNGDV